MNITTHPRSKTRGFLNKLWGCSLSIFMLGAIIAPVHAAVSVEQQPLTIQKPLAPNLTLMLDDSGSMAYDYMPDWNYLANTTDNGARNAANNGTYYNPAVTYTPPPKADGSNYPASPGLTNAYNDGFLDSRTVDITQYSGSYPYYTRFMFINTTTYDSTKTQEQGCNKGYDLVNTGYWWNPNYQCYKKNKPYQDPITIDVYSCNYGDTLNGSNRCETTTTSYKYYFTYTTGPATGPYVQHYVGDTGDCAALPADSKAVCDDGAVVRQNVANWFSYYRTRMLLSKSGLMTAFFAIDPTFRIGFGSINGRNDRDLPSPKYSANGNTIAAVQAFGNGSNNTQKSSFWNWLVGVVPSNSTPLRAALDTVGQYYQQSQPWQTSSSDTAELACRQSYTILTTDGFWNGSLSNGPNNADGTSSSAITGPNGQSYTYKSASPYADTQSNTLSDVAMKYWKTDLRPTLTNEVPPSVEDPAFWQHMTTFTLGLGFTPVNISPNGTTIDQIFSWANGGSAIAGFKWPSASSDSINNIADLAHAAVDGHGGFFSATSPQTFLSGVQDALKRASERVGTGASLAANSTQLKTGTVAYQANYYTAKWKGDLKAFAVDPNSGEISTTPTWTAVTSLPDSASRNIWTYNPSGGSAVTQFVTFSSPAKLNTAEKTALGGTATLQQNMINYLRGNESMEQKNGGGIYRSRETPLGDVVDSQPVFAGAPDPNQFTNATFTGSSSFSTYASDTAARTPLIFFAANDGMLHALDSTTGAETFAYLPSAVITDGLSALSDPAYGGNSVPHQYFNDGELTVADAYFGSPAAWHTVAVGTTGRGTAKAVYAFDVTDPSAINLLWERSAGDGKANSNHIGQMTGKPIIAQTDDGTWSVMIGNGYNSAAGVAALLQFKVSDGTLTAHTTTDAITGNGLAAPAVWLNNPGNGISTTAYAGDLHGHVWSFTLNDGTDPTPSSTGSLLFTAKGASGNVQPITGGMLAGKDPSTSNLWLFFGTGEYLNTADLTDLSTQAWYGLIVSSPSDGTLVSNLSMGRSALVKRAIVAEVAGNANSTPPVLPARAVTATPTAPDMAGKSGWYMDLTSPVNGAEGERMVTPNQFQGNLLLATTRIPQAVDPCNPSGRGWIMAVNPYTGTAPSSSFFDLNGDGQINDADLITVDGKKVAAAGVGFSSLPNNPVFVGGAMLVSFDNGTTGSLKTAGTSGAMQRVSWRELINQ